MDRARGDPGLFDEEMSARELARLLEDWLEWVCELMELGFVQVPVTLEPKQDVEIILYLDSLRLLACIQ